MTADLELLPQHHQTGRSATSGAGGHELPWRRSTAPNLAASTCSPFISQIRSGTLPSASVGNMSLPLRNVAGPTSRLPEMVGRQFLASSHEPGSQTARDSTDGHPRGPFVGSDPPRMFLSHALKHRSGNVPDQRNVFTFAEIQDGRRT